MNSENFFLPSQSLERVELTEENEEKEVYSKEIGVPVKNSSAPLLGPPPMKTTSSEKLENEGKILDDEAEVSGSDVSEDEQVEGSEADDGFLLADEDSEEEQDEKNLIKKIREMEKERDTREVEAIKAEVISGYKRHMYQFQDEQEALLAAARRRAKKDREKYKDAGNFLFLLYWLI
ncbi:uncharacterized protein LOC135146414 [Zophobas morio]|uniref:uncharacterized protein LOC135146414 n=1 Tax=Zophobas morio TaxID=2755281 RepID=UPI0030839438